jgi:hypothetical protein
LSVDAGEKKLADLRTQASRNAERTRKIERIRAAVSLNGEINQHQLTLERAIALEIEATRLSETIGSIAANDDTVTRIEEAVTEMSASEAAMNAVATTVSFAIEKSARKQVFVDEKALETPSASLSILGKTVIAIHEVGTIFVEPQIKNRDALIARRQKVNDELKAALEAAGVHDLTSARIAAAQRREYERRLAEIRKEMMGLAPGNRSKRLAAGLGALKHYVGELRGRLKAEMEKLALATLPEEGELADEIEKNHEEGARLATDIETAEAVGRKSCSLNRKGTRARAWRLSMPGSSAWRARQTTISVWSRI